ncbi:conserved membrane hypothetical protein. Putative C4-dicarboxylate transporter [Tenacibaculum maritimum]|nr:conserved membrane hypothetical protein. Putative C4-dicarboxylate transporter [Tenacibaculum maritimum]
MFILKKLKFPTPHTILLLIAGFVALLTWCIPSGKFDTLQYQKKDNSFIYTHLNETKELPANQETLENLGIKIPLNKFTDGDIGKPISIPKTYTRLAPSPQGLLAFFKSPIKGIIQSSDIILFVLILGGVIGIMNFTGAFDAGISWLANTLKGKEYWLIIVVTTLIAIGGTTFGLAEETIAFYPILIPIFLAAKYDAIVALACVYIGSSIGTMCSTVNPFSVIIASDAAGINWTTGFTGRLIMLLLGLAICIFYILRYANKVQKDPTKSIIFKEKESIENLFGNATSNAHQLTNRLRLILIVFSLCFVIMIYGVSRLNWWFEEMTVVFLVGAILIGVLGKIKEDKFVAVFIQGASDLLSVAFIIGIARGVSILMEQGFISDTILQYANDFTSEMPKGIFANVLLFIYSGLSFFIPSSSGMAVLTMPIMSPLADTVGIGREIIVNAYQYGMGLFAFINPTGLILASLAIVKIGYDKWLKFIIPLVIILTFFTVISLTIQVYL